MLGVGVGGITGITSTQPQLGITDVVITSVIGPVPVKAEKLDDPLNIVLEKLFIPETSINVPDTT
jgi:hypothetical protein